MSTLDKNPPRTRHADTVTPPTPAATPLANREAAHSVPGRLRVAIGSDHAGFTLKELLKERLADLVDFVDVGTHSREPSDYPIYARRVAELVLRRTGGIERGIMLGGSGQGECIASNKFPGIRAALVFEPYSARLSVLHNNANVLTLGERVTGPELAVDIARVWLTTRYQEVERHQRRIGELAAFDRRLPQFHLRLLGQSIWVDQVSRGMLRRGELRTMIWRDNVTGLTANPTIFQRAVSACADYDDQILALARAGVPAEEIFFALAQHDLGEAADTLRPIYDLTQGDDGYVSFEIAPELAYDTAATVAAASQAWAAFARPNIMIKIPATDPGIPAIEEAVARGINVNITLLFARSQYDRVREAYLRGLERRVACGQPVDQIFSVASFFVSRVDTLVDQRLDQIGTPAAAELRGRAAIANAKLAYQDFKRTFQGQRWEALAAQGARRQKPLWASTGVKNPAYRDVRYVEELIGADTVNTMPSATLAAFIDHGYALPSLEEDLADAEAVLNRLSRLGVDLRAVTDQLQSAGVTAFAESYAALLATINRKAAGAAATGEASNAPNP